jgi:hypothetical protein
LRIYASIFKNKYFKKKFGSIKKVLTFVIPIKTVGHLIMTIARATLIIDAKLAPWLAKKNTHKAHINFEHWPDKSISVSIVLRKGTRFFNGITFDITKTEEKLSNFNLEQ